MDHAGHAIWAAADLVIRQANTTSNGTTTSTNPEDATRPAIYKVVGICLAIASGVFIGISFVFKKVGLLRANDKYNEVAGEGYGYLKNLYWWGGMTLMIVGEICNFVAYAFTDAILVTPMGALSVVITAILSAIFLKERLSMVGKVGCFLCIIGSVVIVLNAPEESSVANIQEMQHYVIAPGFLSFAGVIIVFCAFLALWVAPRYAKKSMLVYLTICSLIGGLSVVATQGLGAAILAQIAGTPQFNQWFIYVLLVFVIATLLTEIIYLNKALNLFNAALVTPTYYVIFTSATIITSAVLFRGFKGTAVTIITVVMGFLTICAGVVLLQLSKSAKDVPDTAVFSGDLDQVRTIAEQAASETEPKADAIRGAGLGTIVRRFSVARNHMELEEAKRLHEEKQADLASIGEGEQFVWDGIRRRKTSREVRSQASHGSFRAVSSSRAASGQGGIPELPHPNFGAPRHPPLGMSHFPSYDDIPEDEEARPGTGGVGSSFFGSIGSFRSRGGSAATTEYKDTGTRGQPVPLSTLSRVDGSDEAREHVFGLPPGLAHQDTSYGGADMMSRQLTSDERNKSMHITYDDHPYRHSPATDQPPTPLQNKSNTHRQFSFHNVFHKVPRPSIHAAPLPGLPRSKNIPQEPLHKKTTSRNGGHVSQGATEEERLGLVKGDTNTLTPDVSIDSDNSSDSWVVDTKLPHMTAAEEAEEDEKSSMRSPRPIPVMSRGRERAYTVETEDDESDIGGVNRARALAEAARRGVGVGEDVDEEEDEYAARRRRWENRMSGNPEKRGGGGGGGGAFL